MIDELATLPFAGRAGGIGGRRIQRFLSQIHQAR